jgi:hypothetical protein
MTALRSNGRLGVSWTKGFGARLFFAFGAAGAGFAAVLGGAGGDAVGRRFGVGLVAALASWRALVLGFTVGARRASAFAVFFGVSRAGSGRGLACGAGVSSLRPRGGAGAALTFAFGEGAAADFDA